jgi:ABC-2 type transport system permease protein
VSYAAKTSPVVQSLINQHLQMAFARLKLHLYMLDSGELDENLSLEQQMRQIEQQTDSSHYIASAKQQQHLPVISYSIPAWLIFGVYFIVMPISLTLLNEVKNGTLIRLKTFPLNLHHYFLVKLLAFYLFSLGQFLILSLIGWRVIPLLIELPPVPYTQIGTLLSTGFIISFAAVSFASIIATLVRSFEQAIVLGGGLNIIMAALSGFMVPLDIMPQALQKIAHFSPMYWSAELVKGAIYGQLNQDYWLSVTYQGLFAAFSLSLSGLLFRRRIRDLSWN